MEVIDQHTQRKLCEDGGRDGSDAAISPGTPWDASSDPELEEQGIDSSPGPPEECGPADSRSSDIWPPEL